MQYRPSDGLSHSPAPFAGKRKVEEKTTIPSLLLDNRNILRGKGRAAGRTGGDIAVRLSRKTRKPRKSWPPMGCCWSNVFGTISDRSPAHSGRADPHVDRGPEGQRHRGRCGGRKSPSVKKRGRPLNQQERAQGGGAGTGGRIAQRRV